VEVGMEGYCHWGNNQAGKSVLKTDYLKNTYWRHTEEERCKRTGTEIFQPLEALRHSSQVLNKTMDGTGAASAKMELFTADTQ
jgi:hypothetical protein